MKKIIFTAIIFVLTLSLACTVGIIASADDAPATFRDLALPDVDFDPVGYAKSSDIYEGFADLLDIVPETLPHTYENGVLSIEVDSDAEIDFYTDGEWYKFDFADGAFTCEVSGDVYNSTSLNIVSIEIGRYTLEYYNFKFSNLSIAAKSESNDIFNHVLLYASGSVIHETHYTENGNSLKVRVDYDENGDYATGKVTKVHESDSVSVYYNASYNFNYAEVCRSGEFAYYLGDEYGWRAGSWIGAEEISAPEGYEDRETAYFTENFPIPVSCAHTNWIDADCKAPKTCERCGKTEGKPLPHTWVEGNCANPTYCSVCLEVDEDANPHTWVDATCTTLKHCSACNFSENVLAEHSFAETEDGIFCTACGTEDGKITIPDFITDIGRITISTNELGLNFNSVWNAFPENLNVRHEDDTLYIEDAGFTGGEFWSYKMKNYTFRLVDGVWQTAITAEDYRYGGAISVHSGSWEATYYFAKKNFITYEGVTEYGREVFVELVSDGILIRNFFSDNDITYKVESHYTQEGELYQICSTATMNLTHIEAIYDGQCEAKSVSAYFNNNWFYMSTEGIWYSDSFFSTPLDEVPELVAGMSFEEVAMLAPCFVSCGDHNIAPTDCTEHHFCPTCRNNVWQATEHDWLDATCDDPETCDACGKTQGEALGHSYEDAGVTAPTCEDGGYTTHTCSTCGDSYTDSETPSLGHDWTDATYEAPKTCSVCGGTEGEPLARAESSESEATAGADDHSGLGAGAIVAIVIGAVVVLGGGGFAIFWFVIKKKRV